MTDTLTSHDVEEGGLAEGWEPSTLGQVAKWGSGGTPKSGVTRYYGGDIPWAVIRDLNDDVVLTTESSITDEGLNESSAKMIEPGSILIAMYGSIGKLGLAGQPMSTNQAIAFANPLSDCVAEMFLFYFLMSQRELLLRAGKGATQQNISQTILKSWPISVPPLAEQGRIVEILEDQLSRLDTALESVQTVRKKAAQFRRSLLHAAFTGALTGHEIESGTIPAGWMKMTMGEVAGISTGKTPTKFAERLEESASPELERDVPFFKVGDMNAEKRYLEKSRVYFGEEEAPLFGIELLPPGSVVFPKAGGAIATDKKRVLKVRGGIDLNCMAVTPSEILDERLLYWFFESFTLSTIADGSVVPQIGKRRVAEIEIPVPPGEEQERIVEILEEQISRLDAVLVIADAVAERSAALRRSLLHSALTGRLTREWREAVNV